MAMTPSTQQQQWAPVADERDATIMWLRGEFAAANAIIDTLLHHLHVTGDHGEYDRVASAVHRRRLNWGQYLHMQQFFPIGEVVHALDQARWRRGGGGFRDGRRMGRFVANGHRIDDGKWRDRQVAVEKDGEILDLEFPSIAYSIM